MKTLLISIATTLGLIVACAAHAQVPAGAPAGTTGQCKDGTWYSGASKKGACHGHQGVKEWYGGADTPAAAPATSTPKKSTTAATTSAPSSAASTSTKTKSSTASSTTSPSGAAPAGATGLCNDGTYYSGESKKGACHGHKGVKDWYGGASTTTTTAKTATPAPAAAPAPMAMPAATPAAAPAKTSTPASGAMTSSHSTAPVSTTPAPGGGAGKVWVNTSSKVYHCSGDRYYGTTKEGQYMSEADAVAKGNHAAHGKACSS